MSQLTELQQLELVQHIRDMHGGPITKVEFATAALLCFENISGLEGLPIQTERRLINQLWALYCDQV
jgi:hypothetical protein